MGGLLYKLPRINISRYNEVLGELSPILNELFGANNWLIPKHYRSKETFGDVDILVRGSVMNRINNWEETVTRRLANKIVETKRAGRVFSINYDYQIQVDFFGIKDSSFLTSYNFMSYNVLGNILGRIFHKFGLKYGENGLSYVLRSYNNHISKEIVISRDMKEILEFIGLSYNTWVKGFDTLEDIFKYVISSRYFSKKMFIDGHIKNHNQRPEHDMFMAWVDENKDNIVNDFKFSKNKEDYIEHIDEYFVKSNIKRLYKEHLEKQVLYKKANAKFNGKIIMELIPNITGKKLGVFIGNFKEHIGKLHGNFENWAVTMEQDIINQTIIKYNKEKNVNSKN